MKCHTTIHSLELYENFRRSFSTCYFDLISYFLKTKANNASKSDVVLLPVVVFVDEVVSGSEGHQMGVVGGGWDGDTPSASDIGVTQLVGEGLDVI